MACLPYARHSALLHTRLIFFGTIRANTLWIHFPVASPRDLRNEARLVLWCNYLPHPPGAYCPRCCYMQFVCESSSSARGLRNEAHILPANIWVSRISLPARQPAPYPELRSILAHCSPSDANRRKKKSIPMCLAYAAFQHNVPRPDIIVQ